MQHWISASYDIDFIVKCSYRMHKLSNFEMCCDVWQTALFKWTNNCARSIDVFLRLVNTLCSLVICLLANDFYPERLKKESPSLVTYCWMVCLGAHQALSKCLVMITIWSINLIQIFIQITTCSSNSILYIINPSLNPIKQQLDIN